TYAATTPFSSTRRTPRRRTPKERNDEESKAAFHTPPPREASAVVVYLLRAPAALEILGFRRAFYSGGRKGADARSQPEVVVFGS
ncbi:hypothetical protein BDA96_09G132600, partial [Sorghum bicolor]